MSGAVIENLSNQKLFYILISLFTLQIVFFLIGALFAPVPTTSMEFEMSMCNDPSKGESKNWFYIRPQGECTRIEDLEKHTPSGSFDLREVVFVAQMPHVRKVELKYSPWFQFLLGILHVEVKYSDVFKYTPAAKFHLEVRMGYMDDGDSPGTWKDYINTNVSRTLDCSIDEKKKSDGNVYDCDLIDLFQLPSNDHSFYLLNIRIPIDQEACSEDPQKAANCLLGKITHLSLIAIHQNGGFTAIWLLLKTIVSPILIAAVYWYWNRITHMARRPMLLEKAIMALGCSMAVLDFPIEWLSILGKVPFLLLLADIRQGIFYCVLFSFWVIFAGEHLIDDTTRNNILSYRFNLFFICVASTALLVYDILERGMQLSDPFHSIWSTENGTMLAYLSLYLATFCTVVYFVFLFYKIWKVWTTIKRKRAAQLYRTCENRRLKVEGIIYRFKFLMVFTLVCAALTIVSYSLQQHGEAQLTDDGDGILTHSTSAFFTGTFGMWNIYVLLLLAMYAPSYKQYSGATQLIDENEDLMDGTTESNPMTAFLKPATD
ncbi:unnamed protein product [Auanema sp. JU1783]|nr:unnamed protein product [Auanema sp. JU1783]